jgi:hypothetical protein
MRNAYIILYGYPEGKPLGRLSTDGNIILKWILRNSVRMEVWTELMWLKTESGERFF